MPNINELKLAKELIKFPSVTPKDAGAIGFLEKQLKRLGFDCKILEFKDKNKKSKPIKNIYARLGKKSPNLCYAGHTDVVPPGDESSWNSDPFTAVERDGRIYGRGAADMKSAIAAYISAVITFLKNKDFKFNGSISFLLTADEEGEAFFGTKKVVEWLEKKKIKIN